jgi:hypothetical protein
MGFSELPLYGDSRKLRQSLYPGIPAALRNEAGVYTFLSSTPLKKGRRDMRKTILLLASTTLAVLLCYCRGGGW